MSARINSFKFEAHKYDNRREKRASKFPGNRGEGHQFQSKLEYYRPNDSNSTALYTKFSLKPPESYTILKICLLLDLRNP